MPNAYRCMFLPVNTAVTLEKPKVIAAVSAQQEGVSGMMLLIEDTEGANAPQTIVSRLLPATIPQITRRTGWSASTVRRILQRIAVPRPPLLEPGKRAGRRPTVWELPSEDKK